MMHCIMILQDDRILLRPWTVEDHAALHRIFSDERTMWQWPEPFSPEATRAWIERSLESYGKDRCGRYAIHLKATGKLIGDCGVLIVDVDGEEVPDLGYIIAHEHWGQGYATQAARLWLEHAFEQLGAARVCANMAEDHVASRRVAEKLGMRLSRRFHNPRNRNLPTCLYEATRAV
jgi:RimJ/RimL family protein N-acetyltransferase